MEKGKKNAGFCRPRPQTRGRANAAGVGLSTAEALSALKRKKQ